MKKHLLMTAAFIVLSAHASIAAAMVVTGMAPQQACNAQGMMETAQVSATISETGTDITDLKSKFDAAVQEIEKSAKEKHTEKFELQSMSYNINLGGGNRRFNNQTNDEYQLQGNVSFTVTPTDKALEIAAMLKKKGYLANINVNAYRGNCAATSRGED